MEFVGQKRVQRRRQYLTIHKQPKLAVLEGSEFEVPIQLYDKIPLYENVDLERIQIICQNRQRALTMVDSVYADTENPDDIDRKLKERLKDIEYIGANTHTPDDLERQNDNISHWMLRLAFCKTSDMKQWFVRNEVNLFRYRFKQLETKTRERFFKISEFHLQKVSPDLIEGDLKRKLNEVILDHPENHTWYMIPWTQVTRLVQNRSVYIKFGQAYVAENQLIEFVVGKFRTECNKWLASCARKFEILMENEAERLVPILKAFGNTVPDADFSSVEGRLTMNTIEGVRRTSFPPCIRQLMDGLQQDKKLKHDGRVQLWAFFKAAGMTLDDALKFTFTRMTAYVNPEKEFKYNVRHVFGKEGGGKGVGAYGCSSKIKCLPADGQYQGCPFKHQRNLKGQLRSWGAKETDIAKIKKKADDGHYQVACSQFFRSTHKDQDEKLDLISILHPNNFFDQSFAWNSNEHKLLKVHEPETDSQTSSYVPEWKDSQVLTQVERSQLQSQKEQEEFDDPDFMGE